MNNRSTAIALLALALSAMTHAKDAGPVDFGQQR